MHAMFNISVYLGYNIYNLIHDDTKSFEDDMDNKYMPA